MSTTTGPTKVSLNMPPRAVLAVELVAEGTGVSRTDTINRAVQFYAAVTGLRWWAAVGVLWRERRVLRRERRAARRAG